MSLIADALRAAQEARGEHQDTNRDGARRLLGTAGGTVPFGRTLADRFPPQLRIAAAVFLLAVAASTALVFFAPDAEPGAVAAQPEGRNRPAEPTIAAMVDDPDPTALAGAPASPAAAGVEVGPADPPVSAPPAPRADEGAAGSEEAAVGDAYHSAPARAAEVPAPLASAPAEPAAPSPAGRLEIRLDGPDAKEDPLFERAVAAQRRRDYPEAVALYQQVVERNPTHAEAFNNLGATLQMAGQLNPARDALRQAVALQPRYAAGWSNLGVVLGALGDAEGAQIALSEAVRLAPENLGAKVNLALHLQKRELLADAQRLLEEVLASDARHAEAHYALARLLESQKDLRGAARHFRAFLSTSGGRFPALEGPVRARLQQLTGGGMDE
jgi:Flp pilus assembly protein TadD